MPPKHPGAGDMPSDGNVLSDWRDNGHKGVLMYRNVFNVRCVFDAEESVKQGMISMYLRDDHVQIEVCLYQDHSKMSIASSIYALDLFGEDPMSLSFKERTSLLNSMMGKFFVVNECSVYHMKVENEAVPVEEFLEA